MTHRSPTDSANRRGGASPTPSRRGFIREGGLMLAGGAIAGSHLSASPPVRAAGSDRIRIGLIGCGQRGQATIIEALHSGGDQVELVALGDVFANQVQRAYRTIKGVERSRVSTKLKRFVGLDAYQQVMQSDADVVFLATPPGFRPQHFESAVASGKHVFMEMPLATDAAGVRRVLAAGELARRNGLAVQVGLQRRHEFRYRQCIEQLRSGAIGKLVFARTYCNAGRRRTTTLSGSATELEYQLRNWHQFAWLSGDQINEQNSHQLDLINWLKDAHPVSAQGQGGRVDQDRPSDRPSERPGGQGPVFDHQMVEYTYADGFKLFSQCRRMAGCWNHLGQHVHGSTGSSDLTNAIVRDSAGNVIWRSEASDVPGKGWQQQQHDMFSALRRGERPNDTEQAAASTMTAILGRLATYSGQLVRWDDAVRNDQRLADTDALRSLEDRPPMEPDHRGLYPIPAPGRRWPSA